jgi:hypothetical protein
MPGQKRKSQWLRFDRFNCRLKVVVALMSGMLGNRTFIRCALMRVPRSPNARALHADERFSASSGSLRRSSVTQKPVF